MPKKAKSDTTSKRRFWRGVHREARRSHAISIVYHILADVSVATIFTDAASTKKHSSEKSSFAVFSDDIPEINVAGKVPDKFFSAKGRASIVFAELYAVVIALRAVEGFAPYASRPAIVFTDCDSVVVGLQKTFNKDTAFEKKHVASGMFEWWKDCADLILRTGATVMFCPGHSGVPGNEMANGMAKEALRAFHSVDDEQTRQRRVVIL